MTIVVAFLLAAIVALGGFMVYDNRTPDDAQQIETSQGEPTLTVLDKSDQNLTTIPADILTMTDIQELDLSNNNLTGALPAEIRRLSNLEVLDISSNKMTGLPAELGQLSKLRVLNASDNQLTGIPHELGNLQNLEVLDLSGNDISESNLNEIRKKLPASTQIIL